MNDSYQISIREYMSILADPQLDGSMFRCNQRDWTRQFQSWNVVYVVLAVILSLLVLMQTTLALVGRSDMQGAATALANTCFHLALFLVFAHLGWFMIVKQKGCCGKLGHAVWATVYIVILIRPILLDLIYWLLAIPVAYMVVSLFQLIMNV
mmetsp:Transcript_8828/g.17682  ORF Transcript_8828/g.17682 Transcript_8828/m.17682 type:complete len:152 (+) Transcript_8828:92-547(+)